MLDGHKWFCSAPMCDAFLVLAQAPGGLSCFLLPRVLPDGTRNGFRIERLKDKLGDRSNASSEIELDGAWARLVGEEGRGVRTIVEMVVHTRLDCVLGSAAGMRQAVEQATHHAAHRARVRQAARRAAADAERARRPLHRVGGRHGDRAPARARLRPARDDAREAAFARIATAVAKYWICKRGPGHAAEALECLGGNGFVEESGLPRLYRQQPLHSIWEGSGNVVCLDVLRALGREPESAEVLLDGDPASRASRADGARRAGARRGRRGPGAGGSSSGSALALQASLLVRHAPAAVADAFLASRLGRTAAWRYGTLARTGRFGLYHRAP